MAPRTVHRSRDQHRVPKTMFTEREAALSRVREDRRRELRYAPGDRTIRLGWWHDDDFHIEVGALRNFSAGGSAIELGSGHCPSETVWVCIVGPGRVEWMPGRVVGLEGNVVRVRFAETLPDKLFTLLI